MAVATAIAQMISVRRLRCAERKRDVIIGEKSEPGDRDAETAIAEFIRRRGVTRCPTACVLPTHGSVAPHDQAALAEHAQMREQMRRNRAARRHGLFSPPLQPPPG